MAYVAVDKSGKEYVYSNKPYRNYDFDKWFCSIGTEYCPLPKGSIKKLIGRTLTWDDEPVELETVNTTNDNISFLKAQKIEVERLLNLAKGHPLMESSLRERINEIEQELKKEQNG